MFVNFRLRAKRLPRSQRAKVCVWGNAVIYYSFQRGRLRVCDLRHVHRLVAFYSQMPLARRRQLALRQHGHFLSETLMDDKP